MLGAAKNITLINDPTVNELEFSKRLQNIFIVLLSTPEQRKTSLGQPREEKTR